MTKITTLMTGLAIWALASFADWLASEFFTKTVTSENLSLAATTFLNAISFASGPLVTGIIIGAVTISVWDLPYIGKRLKRMKSRIRNKAKDEALASECTAVSKALLEQDTLVRRMRSERSHNFGASESETFAAWDAERSASSRENERFERQHGHAIQNILVKLKNKGVDVEFYKMSVYQYHLAESSYLFNDIAHALIEGNYLERKFAPPPRNDD